MKMVNPKDSERPHNSKHHTLKVNRQINLKAILRQS
jgi:hypothetical protein